MGVRPYVPIESKRKEFGKTARIYTELLDDLYNKAALFEKVAFASKPKTLYGTMLFENIPYFETVEQKISMPEMIYDMPTGGSQQVTVQVPRLRFRITAFAPWEVYVDPYATGLEDQTVCRYVIKFQLVSKRQIARMAEQGAYPGFDVAKLFETRTSGQLQRGDHWGLQMLSEIGLNRQEMDDDIAILARYESPDRYIDVIDDQFLLRDIDNPYKHKQINLSRWVHAMQPHTQDKFWGEGEAKPGEILQAVLNDIETMTLNNHFMLNQMMIYYRDQVIDPEDLVRTPGQRVPVKNAPMDRPLSDSIYESPGVPLPRDHYALSKKYDEYMDIASGVFNPIEGQPSEGSQTATESAMLKEAGDVRQELNIKLGEMFLADLARKSLAHIDQFATMDDVVESVGIEGAIQLQSLNPADLPGGYNFAFKGSDRVSNQLIKQRNWKELVPLLAAIPNVLQGELAKKLLEVFDVPENEIEQLVIPDEIMMQLQMAVAAQQMPQQPGGKFKENNTKQETQQSARAARGV